MKRSAIVLIVVLAVLAVGLIFLLIEGQAQRGPGYGMGPGYGYGMGPGMMGSGGYGGGPQYCPYCGSYLGPGGGYGMGPGMMGPGYGYGMGPGMMGRGYGYGPQYKQLEKPLGKKDAMELLENYVQSLYNPDLKVGKITEKDTYFEGEILTKKDVLVDTIIVDKNTGWMSSAMTGPGMGGRGGGYGYGMGPGMMGRGYPGYGSQYGSPYGPPQYQGPQGPLKEKDVKAMLENYVQSTRNPNLKVGKITEKDTYFEGEILTKNNALVDKILVDKNTGWMRSIYQ
jgi:hypothetical protein